MKKLALLALVVGCSSSTSSSTAPHTGTLTVTVTAPAGLTTNVTITGPGGFTQTITSTTTLAGVAPGSYAIAAADVTSKDSIVGSVYLPTVTGSPATVAIGDTTTSTVNFAMRPGSGALWVVGASASGSNEENGAIGYTVDQLRASGSVTPAVHLSFSPVTSGGNIADPNTVAIDPRGNLWVVNDNSNTLVEYSVSALSVSGSPTPAVTIQLAASSVADAMAFDANGDLWAGTEVANTIVAYTPSQLSASGSPTPAVTITAIVDSTGNTGGYPMAMAFDAHGNLWVLSSTTAILTEYTPSQLTANGKVIPAAIVHTNGIFPYGMAFDASGNLWLATIAPASLVEFSAASLATSGTPVPAVTLTVPGGSPSYATTVAFDNSGDLWYSDLVNGNISELVPSQLQTSASVTPTVTVNYAPTPIFAGLGIAFSPHAAALPLH